jgi:hypothetical protein
MGFVFQALGSVFQGESTKAADDYNAAVARQNAAYTSAAGQTRAQDISLRGAAQGGRIRAVQGANNITIYQPGKSSAENVRESSRMGTQLSATRSENDALIAAHGYQSQAALDVYAGKTAQIGGYIGAAGDVAGGVTEMFGVPTSVPGGGGPTGPGTGGQPQSLGDALRASGTGYDYDLATVP